LPFPHSPAVTLLLPSPSFHFLLFPPQDVEQRKVFLRTVSELPKVQDASEAVVIIKAALAENLVETKALNDAKDVLDSAKKTLDETLGADATVFAAYHHGCAVYYKVIS